MARLLVLTALALGAAAATPASAQPSPYVSGYVSGDRYGPAPTPPATPAPYGQAARASAAAPALRGRVLAWPGKVEAAVPVMRAEASPTAPGVPRGGADAWRGYGAPSAYHRPVPAQAYAGQASPMTDGWRGPTRYAAAPPVRQAMTGPRAMAAALAGAPTDGWRPVFAGGAGPQASPPAAAAAPASRPTYAPAVAYAAPPNRALAADRRYGYDPTQDHSVRFYSVARPFGLRPDPAPIPPQFFTATADLGGDPPGPLPVNHTTAATRAAVLGGSDTGGQ